jgi:hypothetical protein
MLLMHLNKTELPNTAMYQHLQSEFLLANTMPVLQPTDQHIIEALNRCSAGALFQDCCEHSSHNKPCTSFA